MKTGTVTRSRVGEVQRPVTSGPARHRLASTHVLWEVCVDVVLPSDLLDNVPGSARPWLPGERVFEKCAEDWFCEEPAVSGELVGVKKGLSQVAGPSGHADKVVGGSLGEDDAIGSLSLADCDFFPYYPFGSVA